MFRYKCNDDPLYCFYDFQVSPSSFDFFTFLYSAEVCRIRRNLKYIYISLIHGPNNKFRGEGLRSAEVNEMFFHNVIVPGLSLLPSISAFCWMPRTDLNIKNIQKENLFPRGYDLKIPTAEYLAHELVAAKIRGDRAGFFTAPNYAKKLAGEFINKKIGNLPFVTITAREITRFDKNGTRSLGKEHWRKILKEIRKNGVIPIMIRDTKNAFEPPFFDDVIEVNLASVHLPFRLALYELALLNFIKASGPAMLLLSSQSESLHFMEMDNESQVVSENWFNNHFGMVAGDQFPMMTTTTEFVWGSEDIKLILDRIKERVHSTKIDGNLYKFSGRNNAINSFNVAVRHFIQNSEYGVLEEDARLLLGLKDISKTYGILNESFEKFVTELEDPMNLIPKHTLKKLHQKFNLVL